jgi:hypothetical protein
MDLSFKIANGPRQRIHSQVRVPRDSWPHFTASDSRFPQTGGSDPRIYIPQEQSGPVITQVFGRNHNLQHYIYCCMRIHCRGNMFTEPLPRNGSTRHDIIEGP